MGSEGEQQGGEVEQYEDARHAERDRLPRPEGRVGRRGVEDGGHDEPHLRQGQGGGVHAGDLGVEGLLLVAEAAEEECGSEHQEEVADDRPRDRQLHDLHLAAQDQEGRNDQLGQIGERGVEEPADAGPDRASPSGLLATRPSALIRAGL